MDEFIDVMIQIAKEAEENPEIVQEAPHTTVVKRLDETIRLHENQFYVIKIMIK